MVLYDNLPVYKESYDMLLLVFEVVKKYEKQYKYTLGDKIKNEVIDLIANIYRANSSIQNRLQYIEQAREQIEILRLYMRLSRDLRIISLKQFADIIYKIENLSKQLYAWSKSVKI